MTIQTSPASWGTSFRDWEAVVPMTTEEAQQHGNYAPWADHREFMDDTVKSPNDVEKQLSLSLLGTIPHIVPKKSDLEVKRTFTKGRKQQIRNRYPGLLMGTQAEESVVAEAYRNLSATISKANH